MTSKDVRWNTQASHRIAILAMAKFSMIFATIAAAGGVAIYTASADSYDWLIACTLFTWSMICAWFVVMLSLYFMYAFLAVDSPPPIRQVRAETRYIPVYMSGDTTLGEGES